MQTTVAASELATGLRLAIVRTARRLRQEAGSDLSLSQGSTLATLDRHGPLTPSELAERERVKRPTATRLITALEEAGLVTRQSIPDDRRSVLIAITPGGRELLEERRGRKSEFLARRLAQLEEKDRATLARASTILERLIADEDW